MTGRVGPVDAARPEGRWWAHCPCGWFETYQGRGRVVHRLAAHDNYAHAGFACTACA